MLNYDVYAGYVAKRLGLPLAKLIVATNENDILARFIGTGRYARGEVVATSSPSMDIQVASNFERLLFEMEGRDGAAVAGLMCGFAKTGELEVADAKRDAVRALFAASRVDEAATHATIKEVLETTGQLVDPHTAVGIRAGRDMLTESAPLVTLATAHPAKFPGAIKAAIGREAPLPPQLAWMMDAAENYTTLANDLAAIEADLLHWIEGNR